MGIQSQPILAETQITHTGGGRQSLVHVDTIGKQREQETVSHLRPTPKIPAAREKNLWYPGYSRWPQTGIIAEIANITRIFLAS